MANPRQRRKSRSGTAKVSASKQSRKNKHKVVVKGPEVLVENWDRTCVLLPSSLRSKLTPIASVLQQDRSSKVRTRSLENRKSA